MTDVIVVTVEAPQNPAKAIDLTGPSGDPGDNGLNGWSPVFSTVVDGERRVQRIINWTGGAGTKPAVGQYVGATALVDDIANAVDIRGPAGVAGDTGPAGADGAVIIGGDTAVITGEGPPDDSTGVDEQLYFDTVSSDLYQKKSGHWELQAHLKGAQGDKGDKGDKGDAGSDGVIGSDGAPGVNGATIRYGAAVPNNAVGADADLYIRTANADLYARASGTYSVIVNLRGPQGVQGIPGTSGTDGSNGTDGTNGTDGADGAPGPTLNPQGLWSSLTTYAAFDSIRVNGQGSYYALSSNINTIPASNSSVWVLYATDGAKGDKGDTGTPGTPGTDGTDGTNGTDGAAGPTGDPGDDGWSPVFATASDGARRVLQVTDWVGGAGTKPATGKYVGATGFVDAIGDGVDFRGVTGADGADGATGPDGNTAMTLTSKSAGYTLVNGDANQGVLHPASDTTARTYTIPANSSVTYPVGTMLTFINQNSAGTITIAITSDTMRLAGDGTTGSRTLAANGVATAIKIASTEWIISGVGLT